MKLERSQIKFARSEESGELIGFVSRHAKTKKLKGVRESSRFGKMICVLSEDLKGTIEPNVLYDVELKPMHKGNGYVVARASPVKFKAEVKTIIVTKSVYQVSVSFGNKIIYFDPKDGKSDSSKTLEGAMKILSARVDIASIEDVKREFIDHANVLIKAMEKDGYYLGKGQKHIIENASA